MTEQEILRLPLARVQAMWAAQSSWEFPGKAAAAKRLAGSKAPATVPVKAPVSQPMGPVFSDPWPQLGRVADALNAQSSRLQKVEDYRIDIAGLKQDVATVRNDIGASLSTVLTRVDAIDRAVAARASVDPAAVAAEVSAAVAAAFKPFAAAVTAAGAEPVIGSMVAATVVERKPALDVFGVEVLDAKGSPVLVDVWDHPHAPAVDVNFIWTPDILRHLLLSQTTGENLWLGGEKGTGKSETCRQWAARTGRAFTRINFTKHTAVEDFIGATALLDGETVFEPGSFLRAFTCPSSVILLDEVTNADPGELAVLNGLLEAGSAVTIGGSVWRRAPGVLVMAADNTLTNGDQSGRYAGTRAMNSALADRFARLVHFGFLPVDQEVDAVVRHTGCKPALARHVVDAVNVARAKVDTGDVIDAPSIRSVCAFIRALAMMPVASAWQSAVAARQPSESAAGLAAVYAAAIDEQYIINNL